MTDLYCLPRQAAFGGTVYDLNTDFRVILKIFRAFEDDSLPEILRWRVALRLFYRQPVAELHRAEAMAYLGDFLRCGADETPGKPLMHWDLDADAIIAGGEVRAMEHVHWWTFLSWFHAMPPGQLSTLVSIRQKLRKGKKLEDWEKEFYRENKARVDMKRPDTAADRQEKARLNALLK